VFVAVSGHSDAAACSVCAEVWCVSLDIERHLEPGERVVWLDRDGLTVLGYFTEDTEEE
jgi:hypothetical protein